MAERELESQGLSASFWGCSYGAQAPPSALRHRASFYMNAIPKTGDSDTLVASMFGVIRNVSVPYGITTPNEPNISSTQWRTVADQKRMLYFFESALTPNTFWVNFKDVDFSAETGKVGKLDLGKEQRNIFSGNVAKEFKPAEPFRFLGLPGN